MSARAYLSLVGSLSVLAAMESIQTQVNDQYARNSFTKKMYVSAVGSLKSACLLGKVLGSLLVYFILSQLSPEFDRQFLTLKDLKSKTEEKDQSGELSEVVSGF